MDIELPSAASEVLDFWFGTPGSPDYLQPRKAWFSKNLDFDAEIRERFGSRIEAAIAGALDAWTATPPGALARILLLDQFTRNSWRDTPRTFAGDAQALAAARAMVATGQDLQLPPVQRGFAYLPYEHAEDLAAQDESVRLFTALAQQAPDQAEDLDYAHRHREIVRRFGRFPHRNAILGRTSTPEELAFLKQPGSSF
ncbi:MAG TPA: DUF924 family protein [Methylibium sp.]